MSYDLPALDGGREPDVLDFWWHGGHGREFERARMRLRERNSLTWRVYEACERRVPAGVSGVLRDLARLAVVLRQFPTHDVVLLDAGPGRLQPDVMAAAILGLVPRRRRWKVALMGPMWSREQGPIALVHRAAIRMADRGIDRYLVQSSEELTEFPRMWGVDPRKLRLNLYFATFKESEVADLEGIEQQDFVFAGGNAHRDHDSLLAAARLLPERRFVIATNRLAGRTLPPNVEARAVPHTEFLSLMASAAAVLTPLKPGLTRAAGQQTYLNAMLLGKVSIVNGTGVWGVHDHIEDGVNGVIVAGSPESWAKAIEWRFAPENADAVERMCAEARRTVSERFTFEHHRANIVRLLNELIADSEAR